MGDDCATEGAGRAGRPVLGQRAQAGLAEDVAAGLAHVGAEVDVQTHGAGVAFALLLILAARGRESLRIRERIKASDALARAPAYQTLRLLSP